VRFRLVEFRPANRTGEQRMFGIVVDLLPANLLPLVVLRSASGWPTTAWVLRRAGPNAWDRRVTYDTGYPADTKVYLY
jgi:hypothetical protein